MEYKVHLGPEQLQEGNWRIVFEVPCKRPKSGHGSDVVCESLSTAATERLKVALIKANVLENPPGTWPNASEAARFISKELLKAKGQKP